MQAAVDQSSRMFSTPQPTSDVLWELAREYHRRAEVYDRSVCTGPIGPDGVQPVGYRELGLVNRNASDLLHEMRRRAEAEGYSAEELRDAMRRYVSSRQYSDDMRASFGA